MIRNKSSDKERRRESVRLHLSDQQLVAVGHVTLRSAMLDKMIALTADRVARGLHRTLQKQYRNFSTPQKLSLIQDALVIDLPEHENAIAGFINEINVARSRRNEIAHSIWRSTEHAEVKRLVKLIGPTHPEKELRRVTTSSMMKLADQLIDLTFEMSDWKMLASQSQMRRFAVASGVQPPKGPLPKPPRISHKDRG